MKAILFMSFFIQYRCVVVGKGYQLSDVLSDLICRAWSRYFNFLWKRFFGRISYLMVPVAPLVLAARAMSGLGKQALGTKALFIPIVSHLVQSRMPSIFLHHIETIQSQFYRAKIIWCVWVVLRRTAMWCFYDAILQSFPFGFFGGPLDALEHSAAVTLTVTHIDCNVPIGTTEFQNFNANLMDILSLCCVKKKLKSEKKVQF